MHDNDPSGTAARRAALRLLISVLWQGKPLEAALGNAFNEVTRPDDRALARAITGGVLRWLPDLDDLIDGATARRLPHDARARMVLRLALAQAILLDTPHHAVVATALPLVESGPRRLVHGVLSRLLREGVILPETPTLPEVVGMRWHTAWGDDALEGLSKALAHEPPTDLALRDPARTAEFMAALEGTSLAPGHVRTSRKGPLTDWPGFAEGDWWVQDFAAGLPARLLGDVRGRRIADLCSWPLPGPR
jgi:16S rRNA (cytosine967-C5)-methyltransferase